MSKVDTDSFTELNGLWGRIDSAYLDNHPSTSTTGSDFKQDRYKMQIGVDLPIYQAEDGNLIAGLAVHYVKGNTHTHSRNYDRSDISTHGYGLLGTLTWYAPNGLYIDGQAQSMWYSSDLSTNTPYAPHLKDNNRGTGHTLSIEAGRKLVINESWSTTPQAQLIYSAVDFESFTDGFGSRLSNKKGNSWQSRLGITLDRERYQLDEYGNSRRTHIYGIANLYYEMAQGSKVRLADVDFISKNDRLWGGIGIGGSYNGVNDAYSLYGEALIDTSLNHLGKSHSARADIGVRIKW